MSASSSHLALPYIQSNQAQKHVTHNQAIRTLDVLVQLVVKSAAQTTPPVDPAVGDCYIVPTGAGADWADKPGQLATWEGTYWYFTTPAAGYLSWNTDLEKLMVYKDGSWTVTPTDLHSLTGLGVNSTADTTNRLSVSSDASLFTHDAQGGHQLKINRHLDTDTASVLFQTDYLGQAEMGLAGTGALSWKVSEDGTAWKTAVQADLASGQVKFPEGAQSPSLLIDQGSPENGSLTFADSGQHQAKIETDTSDNFSISVSDDGTTFRKAMSIDRTTGKVDFPYGATGVSGSGFGSGNVLTVDYSVAKGTDLVVNGTGLLGNRYNFPEAFQYDPMISPDLPASFSYSGYFSGVKEMTEFLPIDPKAVYRLSTYLRQEAVAGDWSNFSSQDRHMQFMGLQLYDLDKNPIKSEHHMRYRHNNVDSMTVLTAPLTPGDTAVQVSDATGWNETTSSAWARGLIIFEYRNAQGAQYDLYSRLIKPGLFDQGAVDKASGQITLNQPFPADMANPDDPNGTWPVGTRLANSNAGTTFKYGYFGGLVLAESDRWYKVENHMGGMDRSGTNVGANFAPGTAFAKVFWLPNYSNRSGGAFGFPDTGTQKVWYSGVSVIPETLGITSPAADGSTRIKVPRSNFDTGAVNLAAQRVYITAV